MVAKEVKLMAVVEGIGIHQFIHIRYMAARSKQQYQRIFNFGLQIQHWVRAFFPTQKEWIAFLKR